MAHDVPATAAWPLSSASLKWVHQHLPDTVYSFLFHPASGEHHVRMECSALFSWGAWASSFVCPLLCIQWGEDIQRSWWVLEGKMERSVESFPLSTLLCSHKSSASAPEGTLPCTSEGFVSGGQIHSGQILSPRSSGYFVSHSNVLQQ